MPVLGDSVGRGVLVSTLAGGVEEGVLCACGLQPVNMSRENKEIKRNFDLVIIYLSIQTSITASLERRFKDGNGMLQVPEEGKGSDSLSGMPGACPT